MTGVRKCLQDAAVDLLDPSLSCDDVKKKAFASHVPCYTAPDNDICKHASIWPRLFWMILSGGALKDLGVWGNGYSVGTMCLKEGVQTVGNGIRDGISTIIHKVVNPFVAAAETFLQKTKQALLNALFDWATATMQFELKKRDMPDFKNSVWSALTQLSYLAKNLSLAANVSNIPELVVFSDVAANYFDNKNLWAVNEQTKEVFFNGKLFSPYLSKLALSCANDTSVGCGVSTVEMIIGLANSSFPVLPNETIQPGLKKP